jgi:hypothetical protein
MKKMYIAVLDEAPDYMVPTLVAHTILGADDHFYEHPDMETVRQYCDWRVNSFRKVVLRVNRREFDKIRETLTHYAGHENTICGGERSCLIVLPVESDAVPNVLKFAKMWKPEDVL